MIAEHSPAFVRREPVDTRSGFLPQNSELNHSLSNETIINTGIKVAAATIFTIGLYKAAAAENVTDLVISGIIMYAGYKIFTHKNKKTDCSSSSD